jgi:hypothetical protein
MNLKKEGNEMGFYRKLPVVIEARRFYYNHEKLIKWIKQEGHECYREDDDLIIRTLEGDHRAVRGDYIIKGVHGEFYPCKPEIFEKTYEEVD